LLYFARERRIRKGCQEFYELKAKYKYRQPVLTL